MIKCANRMCHRDTGSRALSWCSEYCMHAWHRARLALACVPAKPFAGPEYDETTDMPTAVWLANNLKPKIAEAICGQVDLGTATPEPWITEEEWHACVDPEPDPMGGWFWRFLVRMGFAR